MTFSSRCISTAVGLALALMGTNLAAQSGQYRYADQQTLTLLDRVNRDARQFDHDIDVAMGRNPNRPVNPTAIETDVDVLVSELSDTTTHLRDHYTRREVVDADVHEVMVRGARIDQFMRRNQLPTSIENSWRALRAELDQVAQAFNLTWNWSSPNMDPMQGPAFYTQLEGTYQLDRSRSDDPARVATQAARGLAPVDRQRVEQILTARLGAPEFLAIDRNGRSVSLASSDAPMARLDIDRQPRSEQNPNGGMSTVRAEFYGDQLSVTTTGNRGRDFTVTFEPLEGGNGLQVTRSIEVAALSTPVTSQSTYRRTSNRADWSIFSAPTAPPPPPRGGAGAGVGVVPAGTVVTGRLNVALGSRTSHQGDRFTMTVTSAGRFQGATLEGTVARAGAGPGRNELVFDFDTIRTRDGHTSEFAGTVSTVRTPDGRLIRVDREGDVQAGASRGDQAVRGGAVGATIGALIGAIANGGKGAAVGAAIGGGLVGGTIYATGADLDLPRGTEIEIISQPIWDRR